MNDPTPLVPRDRRNPPWRVLDPDAHVLLYVDSKPDAPAALRGLADALEQHEPPPGVELMTESVDVRVEDEGWSALALLVVLVEPPDAATP